MTTFAIEPSNCLWRERPAFPTIGGSGGGLWTPVRPETEPHAWKMLVSQLIAESLIKTWMGSEEADQCPGNAGRANGRRLPEVIDDLNCKSSIGGFGASSHVNIVP
jgi:hypothetical protein